MTEIQLRAGVPKLIELDAPYNVKTYSNAVAVYIGESPLQCHYPLEHDDQTILTVDFYARADSDTTITLTPTFSPDIAARLDWMQIKIDENTDGRVLLVARVTQNEMDIATILGSTDSVSQAVQALTGDVATNTSNIQGLTSLLQQSILQITDNTQGIATLGTRVTSNDEDIEQLELRTTATEQGIANAMQNIANLDASIDTAYTGASFNTTSRDLTLVRKNGQQTLVQIPAGTSNQAQVDTIQTLARRSFYAVTMNDNIMQFARNDGTTALFTFPLSTAIRAGLVKRATNDEAAAGTDSLKYVTPQQLKIATDAISNARSFVNASWDTASRQIRLERTSGTVQGVHIPDATDSTKGLVQAATDAQVRSGADTTRYITPRQLKFGTIERPTTFLTVWSGSSNTPYINPLVDGLYFATLFTTGNKIPFYVKDGVVIPIQTSAVQSASVTTYTADQYSTFEVRILRNYVNASTGASGNIQPSTLIRVERMIT